MFHVLPIFDQFIATSPCNDNLKGSCLAPLDLTKVRKLFHQKDFLGRERVKVRGKIPFIYKVCEHARNNVKVT